MILYETISGKLIDLEAEEYNPDNMDDIISIAGILSKKRRYNERTEYTVAEHSLWMADKLVEPLLKLYALLHDAPEAITGDIPSPIVMYCARPDGSNPIKEIQDKVFIALLKKYGIPYPSEKQYAQMKYYDVLSLFVEKRDTFQSKNIWIDESDFVASVAKEKRIYPSMDNELIKLKFIETFFDALDDYKRGLK